MVFTKNDCREIKDYLILKRQSSEEMAEDYFAELKTPAVIKYLEEIEEYTELTAKINADIEEDEKVVKPTSKEVDIEALEKAIKEKYFN